ncbi:hypothetical protein QG37_07490 [Candidozyma auris]|nr:hypothetical protein QG37_07490 [[Candida] auris]
MDIAAFSALLGYNFLLLSMGSGISRVVEYKKKGSQQDM